MRSRLRSHAPHLLLLACCTLCSVGLSSQSSTPEGSALRVRVDSLLDQPAPATEWLKLGPDALTVLQQIFNDPSAQPDRRARALATLGEMELPGVLEQLV